MKIIGITQQFDEITMKYWYRVDIDASMVEVELLRIGKCKIEQSITKEDIIRTYNKE